MTHQNYYENVFHEYHEASIAFLDTGIEESEKHITKITTQEYEIIKKRFEVANEKYFEFLGYLNKKQPDMSNEFSGFDYWYLNIFLINQGPSLLQNWFKSF